MSQNAFINLSFIISQRVRIVSSEAVSNVFVEVASMQGGVVAKIKEKC